MTLENVELVHRAFEAYQREDIDAFVAFHHPDCEFLPRIGRVEGRPYRGHEGVRAYWRDMTDAFERWQPVAAEVRDHEDAVIVRTSVSGRGRDSRVSFVDEEYWQAAKMRDGLIVWWATYPTEAEALEAIGLG